MPVPDYTAVAPMCFRSPGGRPIRLVASVFACLGLLGAVLFPAAAEPSGLRERVLAAMDGVMGPIPPSSRRCDLDVRVKEEVDCGDYLRRDLTYQSEPGCRVPAFLLLPKAALLPRVTRTFPAVLALHQTHALGRRVVVGLGQSPDDEYGVELVRRGFVVLAPAYPMLADYAPDLAALGYVSGSRKAVWDNIRGLDLLASIPAVRTNGFGCIGHSLGGHNGLFTAAADERIRAVVTSCGFDAFVDYRGGNPDLWRAGQGWCQTRYMPRLAAWQGRLDQLPFDFPDVLAAIAPRRIFVNAPLRDSNFRWDSVDRVVESARQRVQAAGVAGGLNVVVRQPDAPHQFPTAIREEAYRLLEAVLQPPN